MLTRILATTIGALAFYMAFFMYEDEEGQWQNRIDELWIAVNDRARRIGSRSIALLGKIAEIVTLGFDRIFGNKLLSVRMIGASTSLSLAVPLILVCFTISRSATTDINVTILYQLPIIAIAAATCVLATVLPAVFRRGWLVVVGLVPLAFVAFYVVVDIDIKNRAGVLPSGSIVLSIALIWSVASDILITALIRNAVRRIARTLSPWRIVGEMLLQCACVLFFTLGPFLLLLALELHDIRPSPLIHQSLSWMAGLNFSTGLLSLALFAVLGLLLLDRFAWPLASRVVYPLCRYQIVRNRKLLAGFGTVCFLYVFGVDTHFLKGVLELFSK